MKMKNGGPAYPISVPDIQCADRFESGYGGMSLRDAFAIAALQGELAASAGGQRPDPQDLAEYVWKLADAVMTARAEGREP